jgi:hypothetical protein
MVIPLLAGARVFPEAQPREWAAAAPARRRGWVITLESRSSGFARSPAHETEKKYIQAYELSEELAGNAAPIVGAYAVIP